VSGISSPDPIADAIELCKQHGGLYIEATTDNVWDKAIGCYRYPRSWKVWRKGGPGGRHAFCGHTRDPVRLLQLVRRLVR
jgi:hypothetical protein